MPDLPLPPATVDDLAAAVRFALRFRHRGKALGKREREDDAAVARNVAEHILGSGFVVLRAPPAVAPDTGRVWGDHPSHGLGREG